MIKQKNDTVYTTQMRSTFKKYFKQFGFCFSCFQLERFKFFFPLFPARKKYHFFVAK